MQQLTRFQVTQHGVQSFCNVELLVIVTMISLEQYRVVTGLHSVDFYF